MHFPISITIAISFIAKLNPKYSGAVLVFQRQASNLDHLIQQTTSYPNKCRLNNNL